MVSQEMALFSNILTAYTFVADQPDRAALVFLSGVSVGLLVTLCAIVFHIHCRADCHYGDDNSTRHRQHWKRLRQFSHLHLADSPPHSTALVLSGGTRPPAVDWDDTVDLTSRRRRRSERALMHAAVFAPAEELDRGQCLEARERILREMWMNGQPEISTVSQSLSRYH